MNDQDVFAVFARLTTLEYFIEVLMAEDWSDMDDEEIELSAERILKPFTTASPLDLEPAQKEIVRLSAEMAQNLVFKISKRAVEIREKRGKIA